MASNGGLPCPHCSGPTEVLETRLTRLRLTRSDLRISIRRRQCLTCRERVTTLEVSADLARQLNRTAHPLPTAPTPRRKRIAWEDSVPCYAAEAMDAIRRKDIAVLLQGRAQATLEANGGTYLDWQGPGQGPDVLGRLLDALAYLYRDLEDHAALRDDLVAALIKIIDQLPENHGQTPLA